LSATTLIRHDAPTADRSGGSVMGWEFILITFLVLMGSGYTLFVYSAVKRDDEEQHRSAGNPNP